MTKPINSRKGQLSIEAGIIILFLILVLMSLWLGGPIQEATEKSTDTNDMILAAQALDEIANAVEMVGMGGIGARKDFVIHMPFHAVNAEFRNEGKYYEDGEIREGPHITLTVILYDDLVEQEEFGGKRFTNYAVDGTGRAQWWERGSPDGPFPTAFYYANISKGLKFPIAYDLDLNKLTGKFPLCDDRAKRNSTEVRGENTRFVYVINDSGELELNDILFCCEAGYNIFMYAERSDANKEEETIIKLDGRRYFSLPGNWTLKT